LGRQTACCAGKSAGAMLLLRQTGSAARHRTLHTLMKPLLPTLLLPAGVALLFLGAVRGRESLARAEQQAAPPAKQGAGKPDDPGRFPHGRKLVLKDGNFQLVREYQRNGERVRYFSVERKDWEEIPAAMVDWDATAKAEKADEGADAALVSKIHAQESAQNMAAVVDVDASLQVGSGAFLPPGEGMFLVEGKSVTPLEQAGSELKTDKKNRLKQILTPIPIVPNKTNVLLPGPHARVRITDTSATPEFYLREAPPDPDRTTPIQRSSRPGESGPEVELVRAKVQGGKRVLESIRSLFGEDIGSERSSISIQKWDIAPSVFRFTLSEPLPPGEYALAEILPGGLNLFVWDFGVDVIAGGNAAPAKPGTKAN